MVAYKASLFLAQKKTFMFGFFCHAFFILKFVSCFLYGVKQVVLIQYDLFVNHLCFHWITFAYRRVLICSAPNPIDLPTEDPRPPTTLSTHRLLQKIN